MIEEPKKDNKPRLAQVPLRLRVKKSKPIKSKVKILRIIKTRGTHSLVETDKGIFRKENKNIPANLFKN